nr:radical SAM protein [uncultured Ruminococcus sp.]
MPHNGCPHQCSFCNQRSITGQAYQPTADDVRKTLTQARLDLGERAKNAEIAFFGGSFTAIDREYMISLLDEAREFEGVFSGIRISTRPDAIDADILALLKGYGVTAIELGAQSMDDNVLTLNERGHSAEDVRTASRLIKSFGFSLGLQMMTGLYGSDFDKDTRTAEEFIALSPDTVRIYPTVVMKGTALEKYFLNGSYKPYTLGESVELCAELIRKFEDNKINIIRVGLHYSDSLIENGYCENYHPAFKELCESKLFYNSFLEKTKLLESRNIDITINRKSLSKLYGQRKCNLRAFEKMGYRVNIIFDDSLEKYEMRIGVSV